MIGPGKYDDICERLRLELGARAVVVIVVEGRRGSGFSVKSDAALMASRLPDVMQVVAEELRRDGAALLASEILGSRRK